MPLGPAHDQNRNTFGHAGIWQLGDISQHHSYSGPLSHGQELRQRLVTQAAPVFGDEEQFGGHELEAIVSPACVPPQPSSSPFC